MWAASGLREPSARIEPAFYDGQTRIFPDGDTAEDAMADIANQLRAIRPDPNG